jgi:hypothetical protein
MQRRLFCQSMLALSALASAASLDTTCPICGGKLVDAGSLKDDRSKPSRNIELWNRSYHGNFWPFYSENSKICSRCYLAFNESLFGVIQLAGYVAAAVLLRRPLAANKLLQPTCEDARA